MSRMVALNAIRGGITLLRLKGGASPQVLRELENAYVTSDRTVQIRPGSVHRFVGLTGTKGLTFDMKGRMMVFSHIPRLDLPAGIICETLRHPLGTASPIKRIHFAEPFVGAMFVVAEFEDGVRMSYWLQATEEWQANHHYLDGTVVQPTIPNGFGYVARRTREKAPPWAPRVARQIGDRIEPTVYNGFEYICIDVIGENPTSGDVEPVWATVPGGLTYEDVDTGLPPPSTSTGGGGATLPPDTIDRYPANGSGGSRNSDFGSQNEMQ